MDEFIQLILLENLEHFENQPMLNNRPNPEDPFVLSERQFVKLFRLTKNLCRLLIDTLTPFMRGPNRPTDLQIQTKVLTALHFYAYGNYQTSVGVNKYICLSQSSVSVSVKEVTTALNRPEIFNEWVQFPNNFEKLYGIRRRFFEEHNIPGVIGAIDCTHIAIRSPLIDHAEYLYVNRKNYHSINVQLVCDADLKILNVNAKYPGSTSDAFIWSRSNVQRLMKALHERGHTDYFLLGDSGYPLRTWLLTPLDYNPLPNTPEKIYNDRHKSTRVKIECCNGVLKSRFRCLLKHRVLHYDPEYACKIINACVILHNMCIEHNVPEPEQEIDDDVDFGVIHDIYYHEDHHDEIVLGNVNPELVAGRNAQRRIIRNLQ